MKLWETAPGSVDERVERFTAGEDVRLDARLLYFDLCGTLAHVMGLARLGLFGSKELASIQVALRGLWQQGLEIKPQDEDVHTAVENALTEQLGELGQKVHTGRSRNDQVLVDLRLYAKDGLLGIAIQLLKLGGALLRLARAHEFVPMPGLTHTRRAMPSSVGLWVGSFVEALIQDLTPLEAVYTLVDRSPLGAAAGYGVPLALDREHVAELLGFSGVQVNSLNAVSSRGKLDYLVLSTLASVLLDLSRLSADLIWMSSEAFDFFQLPEKCCTGSSLMPHKRNPDVLELVRAKATRVQAHAAQAFALAHGLLSGYHRDHQELKGPLMDGLETTLACLEVLVPVVAGLRVNEAALQKALTPDLFAVDAVIDKVKAGVPLRQAYRQVKANLDQIPVPDVEAALRARSHLGGPGNLQLDALQAQLEAQQALWRGRKSTFEGRLAALVPR